MEPIDGMTVSPPHAALHLEDAPTSPATSLFMGYTPEEDEPESYNASDNEDDTEMSDGGVLIDLSGADIEQLNPEMDMVDAELLGSYNITIISTNPAFHAGLVQHHDSLEDFTEYGAGVDAAELDYDPEDEDEKEEEDGEDDESVQQTAPVPDPMSAVSEQLQNLQDGQEQGELITSAMLHGSIQNHMDDTHNLNLRDFLFAWVQWGNSQKSNQKKKKHKEGVPNITYINKLGWQCPMETFRSDLRGAACDIQAIDWTQMGVERREARRMRLRTYKNYTNLKLPVWHNLTHQRCVIEDGENYFKFRHMDFGPKLGLSHFQLRNLLACTSRNNICYAGEESKVYTMNPLFGQKAVRMDLTDTAVQTINSISFNGIQISTIAAGHNVLIAGGFAGEYGMIALDSPSRTDHIEGLITTDPNPITNHIQIHLNRHSGLPRAVFASNDTALRTLDCTRDMIVAHHKYDFAINCSAISPDHRLRVVVGDNRNVIICDAEKGEILQDLTGHMDYGFACAWADNGWHVATGYQDKLIKIWDARMWTDQQGNGKPVETVAAMLTGARSLKFSPLGSGKRILVAAEAADIVAVIDAETYKSKQSLDFFGEIGGVDFTPDGQTLFVGIHDSLRGGIMEFERCGFSGLYAAKEPYDQIYTHKSELNRMGLEEWASGSDWKKTDAEVVDDPRSRRTVTHRQRKVAQSWDMDPF